MIDEASSLLRIQSEKKPSKLSEIDEQIIKIRNECLSLSDNEFEKDIRIIELKSEKLFVLTGWYQRQKDLKEISELISQIKKSKIELMETKKSSITPSSRDNSADLLEKESVKIRKISDINDKILEFEQSLNNLTSNLNLILSSNHIADLIAQSTGINVGTLQDKERDSLVNMENHLAESIFGQDEALVAISKCIRQSRAGLRFHDRPLGVFFLLGSTGVGKTELAKKLNEFLFKNATSLIRLDMSEYGEKFTATRLSGAPPGYVGYEEGGILTESVRKNPYSVILLDEFEKSHKEVANLLLSVFDEGRLVDSKGRLIDFRNTVIIMTSNLGHREIYSVQEDIEEDVDRKNYRMKKGVEIVERFFAPEFVARLDAVITFNPLDEHSTKQICKLQVDKITDLLLEKDIKLELSPSTYEYLVENGYDSANGARTLKRLMQNVILTPLSDMILTNQIIKNSNVYVTTAKDQQYSKNYYDILNNKGTENSAKDLIFLKKK